MIFKLIMLTSLYQHSSLLQSSCKTHEFSNNVIYFTLILPYVMILKKIFPLW